MLLKRFSVHFSRGILDIVLATMADKFERKTIAVRLPPQGLYCAIPELEMCDSRIAIWFDKDVPLLLCWVTVCFKTYLTESQTSESILCLF